MRIRIFNSLRAQLTLYYALVLAFIFIISDIVLYQVFKKNLMSTVDYTLITAAEQSELYISKVPF